MGDVWVESSGSSGTTGGGEGAPRLLAAVPCEDGAASAAMADGRVSLQRIYYDVYADEFPTAFDRLNVATVWMGGAPGREYAVGARLSGPGGEVLAEVETVYRARPAPATATMLLHFSSDGVMLMRLPAPGRYSVDVLLEGVPVFGFPIYAIEAERPTTETRRTQRHAKG